MTTKLHKPVTRETRTTIRDRGSRRALIITLEPNDLITIRPKGTRARYTIDIETTYQLAVRIHVRDQQLERARARGTQTKRTRS